MSRRPCQCIKYTVTSFPISFLAVEWRRLFLAGLRLKKPQSHICSWRVGREDGCSFGLCLLLWHSYFWSIKKANWPIGTGLNSPSSHWEGWEGVGPLGVGEEGSVYSCQNSTSTQNSTWLSPWSSRVRTIQRRYLGVGEVVLGFQLPLGHWVTVRLKVPCFSSLGV